MSLSTAQGFALMLETACEEFEVLQRLIRHEIRLLTDAGSEDHRGAARVRMALAKSFVFNVVRARRICEHGVNLLTIDRIERTRFLKATASVTEVRDVNEHGFDSGMPSRRKKSRPARHIHATESAILDETSMVILGDQKILMGPLNLYHTYVATDHMRRLAGFANLPPAPPGA